MSITSTPTAEHLSSLLNQRLPGKVTFRTPRSTASTAFVMNAESHRQHPQRLAESDLATIFASPAYDQWAANEPLLFWAPLLGLYMGVRASEAAALSIDDIIEPAGLMCIVLNNRAAPESESATASKYRTRQRHSTGSIPVPKVLLDAGFPDYVAAIKSKDGRELFPTSQRERTADTAAWLRSKFARYLRSHGIKKSGFSALRQTFGERLMDADISWADKRELARASERHFPAFTWFLYPSCRMSSLKKSLNKISCAGLTMPRFMGDQVLVRTHGAARYG